MEQLTYAVWFAFGIIWAKLIVPGLREAYGDMRGWFAEEEEEEKRGMAA